MQARNYPDGKGVTRMKIVSGVEAYYAPTSATNKTPRLVYAIDPIGRTFASCLASTDNAGNTLRFNSITNTGTANDFIGFQCKPAQGAATAQSVKGGEISPRVNSGIALSGSGGVIGLHVDAFLKGTAAGTIAGSVRGIELEMITDDGGTRTISGDVSMLRFRAAFSATTITGKFVPIRIEKAETQTNSKQFDAVLELPSTNAGVWHDTQTSVTGAGYITVLVNGNVRYITLTSGAPS